VAAWTMRMRRSWTGPLGSVRTTARNAFARFADGPRAPPLHSNRPGHRGLEWTCGVFAVFSSLLPD
jgi:hypothetical protein